MMDSNLSDVLIHHARGIGPQRAKLLAKIGINSVKESLWRLPYRYEDRTGVSHITDIKEGSLHTIRGRVIKAGLHGGRGRRQGIFEILVNDGSSDAKGRWFNQPFMKKNLRAGREIMLSGEVGRDPHTGMPVFDSPEYEIVGQDGDSFIHVGRIVPIYGLTEGISQKQMRKIMFGIVADYAGNVRDPLPEEIIRRHNLPPLRDSIKELHFPSNGSDTDLLNRRASIYHKRLVFDELFTLELGVALMKKGKGREKGRALVCKGAMRRKLMRRLPFGLTGAQERVVDEITRELSAPHPMRRLLQGDVGCGKTVVALLAMLHAVECGCQTAFMAPTEILAEQHYYTLCSAVEDLGVKTALVVGGKKERHLDMIAGGEAQMVVGTHALITEGVGFKDLGLVVIDEQHKFGVMQRGLLSKKGVNPDVLVMTATPIPRSLALTLYGDLDYSVIDEMPSGRKPIVTKVYKPGEKTAIYAIIGEAIENGGQAYVVYPLIEESGKTDLRSAVRGWEALRKVFPRFRVGLLHGRMSLAEREAAMSSFKRGEIHILVSTTVIEVGVDVPNATVMIIVHAERFGLAKLHHLRGWVGWGGEVSYCLLISHEASGENARRRLNAMVMTTDGFTIAEEDLEIRGPGEFLGTRQAGMPDLKVADLVRDLSILEAAKTEAFDLVDAGGIDKYPLLKKSVEAFGSGRIDCCHTA